MKLLRPGTPRTVPRAPEKTTVLPPTRAPGSRAANRRPVSHSRTGRCGKQHRTADGKPDDHQALNRTYSHEQLPLERLTARPDTSKTPSLRTRGPAREDRSSIFWRTRTGR